MCAPDWATTDSAHGAICEAVANIRTATVLALLDAKVPASARDGRQFALLHLLAQSTTSEGYSRDKGVVAFTASTGRSTPGQRCNLARILIAAKADIAAQTVIRPYMMAWHGLIQPLHLCACPLLAEALLAAKADASAKTATGRTPLHEACSSMKYATIACLLKAKSDVHAVSGAHRRTPLHCAAFLGRCGAIRMLVEHKASVDCEDSNRWTPLRYAEMQQVASPHQPRRQLAIDLFHCFV